MGPSLCGVAPRRSQDVGMESHWPVVVTARCHGQERAALDSQGHHSVHTAPSKRGAQPRPSGRRTVAQKSPVSTALEFPATLGHGLDVRVRVRPARHGLGRPKGWWEQRRFCTRPA